MEYEQINIYRHSFKIMLSKFKEEIDHVNKFNIANELDKCDNLDTHRKKLNAALLKYDIGLQNKKDKPYIQDDLATCVNKLKCIVELGLDKETSRLEERKELEVKSLILVEAFLLKRFSNSILVEEDGYLTGVILNKTTGEADTIKIPLHDGCSMSEDLLNHVHSLYNISDTIKIPLHDGASMSEDLLNHVHSLYNMSPK